MSFYADSVDNFAEHREAGLAPVAVGAAQPAAPLPAMPGRLLGERPPRRWQLPLPEEGVPLLRRWVARESAELVDWLLARHPPLNPFEHAWQLQDADRLREGFPEPAHESRE